MGFQTSLLTGIAEYLDTAQVGTWDPAGTYTSSQTAITIDTLPSSPDKAIALSLYPVHDSHGTDSIIGCQAWIRGSPRNRVTVKDLADDLFNALHGVNGISIGGIPIILIERDSQANLGEDGNNRQEISANYYIHLTRATAHKTD